MKIVIRKSKDNQWGFVETFDYYRYGSTGSISVTVGITPDGKFAKSYIYRGEDFVLSEEIEKEMGIEKYIKAKKPFYSRLSDGFVATVKAGVNFDKGELILEKSDYVVYSISGMNGIERVSQRECSLQLIRLLEIPDQVDVLMKELIVQLASCVEPGLRDKAVIRSNFIKKRF